MLILIGFVSDECRQIEFGDALSNSRLSDHHVIHVYHVQNEPSCRVKCFLEPDCVAYNYGKNNKGNLQCELCNKSHLQVPSNHVMVTPGFIFRPVAQVFLLVLFSSIFIFVFKIRLYVRSLLLAVSSNCKCFVMYYNNNGHDKRK